LKDKDSFSYSLVLSDHELLNRIKDVAQEIFKRLPVKRLILHHFFNSFKEKYIHVQKHNGKEYI